MVAEAVTLVPLVTTLGIVTAPTTTKSTPGTFMITYSSLTKLDACTELPSAPTQVRVYVVSTVGSNVSVNEPLIDLDPLQPLGVDDAVQDVTLAEVQLTVVEVPGARIVDGVALRVKVGGDATITVTFAGVGSASPFESVTVSVTV